MDRQYVGIDFHRRRSVIVRMAADGERLGLHRIVNDPFELAKVLDVPITPVQRPRVREMHHRAKVLEQVDRGCRGLTALIAPLRLRRSIRSSGGSHALRRDRPALR
jgi:hypothetical protein